MAKYFGESGCWKNLLLELKQVDIIPESLPQIHEILHTVKKQYIEEQAKAEMEFNQQRLFVIDLIRIHQDSSQKSIEKKSLEISQQIELLDQKIKLNKSLILEKTKGVENDLNLQLDFLFNQLSEINQQIASLTNKINEIIIIFDQKGVSILLQNKPNWYNIFARIIRHFSIKKQKTALHKESQTILAPYQVELNSLTDQKNKLLGEKNILQKEHPQTLENMISPIKQEIANYHSEKQTLSKEYERTIKVQNQNLEKLQQELNYLDRDKTLTIKDKTRITGHKIEILEQVLESPEYKGAIAELEMIEYLKKLPNDYFVFSDVLLKSNGHHYHNRKPLKYAQIDHLVVSSKGIFIIEVKNWSKESAEKEEFRDPYEQVTNANNLCFSLLKDDFEHIKIESIIAYKNSITQKKYKSNVKILHISYVNQYITGNYFPNIFTKNQVQELIFYFKKKIEHHRTKTENYFETKGRFY